MSPACSGSGSATTAPAAPASSPAVGCAGWPTGSAPSTAAGLLNASRHALALGALTAREHDVLALMAEGRSNSAVAGRLVVSERAVEKHISNIFSKLGLSQSDSDHRRVLAVLAYLGT
jgi:DNA-binding NarL/FixJ family response regulator